MPSPHDETPRVVLGFHYQASLNKLLQVADSCKHQHSNTTLPICTRQSMEIYCAKYSQTTSDAANILLDKQSLNALVEPSTPRALSE